MEIIKLEKIGLGSYLKMTFIGGFTIGLIIGIFGFILSLFNPNAVTLTIGYESITGVAAGAGGIVAFPVIISIIFSFFSLFIYLGLLIYLKFRKTIDIKIKKIS